MTKENPRYTSRAKFGKNSISVIDLIGKMFINIIRLQLNNLFLWFVIIKLQIIVFIDVRFILGAHRLTSGGVRSFCRIIINKATKRYKLTMELKAMSFMIPRPITNDGHVQSVTECLRGVRPEFARQSCLEQQTTSTVDNKLHLVLSNRIILRHARRSSIRVPP